MALYCRNATATRFGATRKCLDASDATASASWSGALGALSVYLYTCTSAGTLTQRAFGTYNLEDLAKASRTITLSNIASDIDIPTGGGVMLRIIGVGYGLDFYSPVEDGHVLKAGSHQVTVTFESWWNGDNENFDCVVYYGAQQTYAPDNIFYVAPSGTPPTITTHPSDATDRTFAQSTSFTAGASGDPAPSKFWQATKDGGSTVITVPGSDADTLTIAAAGHNFKYRAVYTNSMGTAYSDWATLTMSTASPDIAAGTYAADTISDYLSSRGSTPVALTGAVTTTGIVTIDNPALVLDLAYDLTVAQVIFKAFKTISGLGTIHTGNWHIGRSTGVGVVFHEDAHFGDVTGTATLSPAELDGILWFGTPVAGPAHSAKYDWTLPDLSNVVISDCTLDNFIRGAANGMTLLRVSGVVDAHSATLHDYPLSFGGSNVTLTDCDFEATFENTVLKVAAHGTSAKGWHISGCTFTGGTEEQTGCEAGITRFVGHVTAKTSTSITVALDTNRTTGFSWERTDAELVTGSEHVGSHVLMLTGNGAGHYHEITAQTDAVLTIDTTRWDTSAIAVNDVMMVAQGMVDCVWENNTHVLKRGYIDHGNGCNVGFSSYGNSWGNTVSDAFSFPHPLTLATAVPAKGDGPVIVAADWAVGIDEFSGPMASNGPLMNAHNTYDGCTFTSDIPVAITVSTTWYSGTSNEGISTPSTPLYYSRGLTVKNCTYDPDSLVQVIDAKEMTWTNNTTPAPSIKYTGYVSSANYNQSPSVRWPYTYRADYVALESNGWKTASNWLWEYGPTLDSDSGTTWGAPLDPSGFSATQDGADVLLAWTDNATNETGYYLEEAHDWEGTDPAELDWSPVATIAADATTYTDTPTYTTRIRYRLAAGNASGLSAWVESNTLILREPIEGTLTLTRAVTENATGSASLTRIVTESATGSLTASRVVAESATGSLTLSRLVAETVTGSLTTLRQVAESVTGSLSLTRIVETAGEAIVGSLTVLRQVAENAAGSLTTQRTVTESAQGSIGIVRTVAERVLGALGVTRIVEGLAPASRLVRRHGGTTAVLSRGAGTSGMLRRGSGATGVTHNRGDAD